MTLLKKKAEQRKVISEKADADGVFVRYDNGEIRSETWEGKELLVDAHGFNLYEKPKKEINHEKVGKGNNKKVRAKKSA